MKHRSIGSREDILVIGGGPLGLSTARALAERSRRRVHVVDANDPLRGDFSALSAACPYAAGQIIIHSFEPDTYAMRLGRRTAKALRELASAGYIDVYSRPWLVCSGNTSSDLDEAVRHTLDTALRDGLLDGCKRVDAANLDNVPGLRTDEIAFAVRDDDALAVDPKAFVAGLARWAVEHGGVEAHFGFRVNGFDGDAFVAEGAEETVALRAGAAVLCTGIHRAVFPDALPESSAVHLHVFDHRDDAHRPTVEMSIAGETTVARYEGFGEGRHAITPHLPKAARDYDINALFTDVAGLRRQLDTHFGSYEEANASTEYAMRALGELQRRFIDPSCLLSEPESTSAITQTTIAQYVRLADTSDPVIAQLETPLPSVYVQPSSGRGLNQCIALGEVAAELLCGML